MSDLYGLTQERVDLSIIRCGIERQIEAPTVTMASYLVNRVVWFCGAQLETPFPPLLFQIRKLYSRIWMLETLHASPADIYDLPRSRFITTINGKPTEDLISFLKVVEPLPEDQYYQITYLI